MYSRSRSLDADELDDAHRHAARSPACRATGSVKAPSGIAMPARRQALRRRCRRACRAPDGRRAASRSRPCAWRTSTPRVRLERRLRVRRDRVAGPDRRRLPRAAPGQRSGRLELDRYVTRPSSLIANGMARRTSMVIASPSRARSAERRASANSRGGSTGAFTDTSSPSCTTLSRSPIATSASASSWSMVTAWVRIW